MERENIANKAQECFRNFPTIILGSGASVPHCIPCMTSLGSHLSENIEATGDDEKQAWDRVTMHLKKGDHLEMALEKEKLGISLLDKIIRMTWEHVNEKDKLLLEIAADKRGKEQFSLGCLLNALFKSTHRKVDIITTNYDRVAEYACNAFELLFRTSFLPGYVQHESTGRVDWNFRGKAARVVNIWKVHGSLDWFMDKSNDTPVGLPVFALPSDKFAPLIITPGINKYERISEEPFRTIMQNADDAINKTSSILCVGYGFRDKQIHPKIKKRCQKDNVVTVVLAHTLTGEAKNFLKNEAGNNYMGIEKSNKGSKVYTFDAPDGIEVEGVHWSLKGFNCLVLSP